MQCNAMKLKEKGVELFWGYLLNTNKPLENELVNDNDDINSGGGGAP